MGHEELGRITFDEVVISMTTRTLSECAMWQSTEYGECPAEEVGEELNGFNTIFEVYTN